MRGEYSGGQPVGRGETADGRANFRNTLDGEYWALFHTTGGSAEWMRDRQAPFAVTDPEGTSTSSFLEIAWRLTEDAAARRAK